MHARAHVRCKRALLTQQALALEQQLSRPPRILSSLTRRKIHIETLLQARARGRPMKGTHLLHLLRRGHEGPQHRRPKHRPGEEVQALEEGTARGGGAGGPGGMQAGRLNGSTDSFRCSRQPSSCCSATHPGTAAGCLALTFVCACMQTLRRLQAACPRPALRPRKRRGAWLLVKRRLAAWLAAAAAARGCLPLEVLRLSGAQPLHNLSAVLVGAIKGRPGSKRRPSNFGFRQASKERRRAACHKIVSPFEKMD